ncbi:hypothetical protein [Nocardia sp. NPDC004260]
MTSSNRPPVVTLCGSDHTRYHGESTRAEIAYATEHGKPVDWAIHTPSTGTCTTAAATQARGSE